MVFGEPALLVGDALAALGVGHALAVALGIGALAGAQRVLALRGGTLPGGLLLGGLLLGGALLVRPLLCGTLLRGGIGGPALRRGLPLGVLAPLRGVLLGLLALRLRALALRGLALPRLCLRGERALVLPCAFGLFAPGLLALLCGALLRLSGLRRLAVVVLRVRAARVRVAGIARGLGR
ncbi:MAG: hypothetical protein ACTHKZ_07165 [Lysobacteraceae bacterium]